MSSQTTEAAGTAAFTTSRPHAMLHGVVAAGLSILASAAGGLVTRPQIPTWYATLEKPFFNPPNWVFGPVLDDPLRDDGARLLAHPAPAAGHAGRGAAIAAYLVQMALNVTWSVVCSSGSTARPAASW